MVTCDRHLDGLLYVAYLTWYDDRVGAINNIHWRRHGHTSVDNCIWRKPPKLRLKAVYSDATQVELIWVASASLYFANATQLNSTSSWVELCRYKRALRQIVQKSILTLCLETPKDISAEGGETHVWDRAMPSFKFSLWSARDICPRAANTHLSVQMTPWGYLSMLYIFRKLLLSWF